MVTMEVEAVKVPDNSMDAYEAREKLGCSYPHLITLLQEKKIKAVKKGKCWFVDSADVERACLEKIVTPRPRTNKKTALAESVNEVTISITMPKEKHRLLEVAMQNRQSADLKKVIEEYVESLYAKVQTHLEDFSF